MGVTNDSTNKSHGSESGNDGKISPNVNKQIESVETVKRTMALDARNM